LELLTISEMQKHFRCYKKRIMFSIREYNSEFLHTNPSKKNTTVCRSVVEFKVSSRYIRACCNLDCWVSAGGECGGINKVKIARVCPRINNWDGNSDVLMKLFIFAYRLLIQTSWTDKYSICPNTPSKACWVLIHSNQQPPIMHSLHIP